MLLSASFLAMGQIQDRVYSSKNREANRLVSQAKVSMKNKHYEQAITLLNQALQYQTNHIDAYLNRAISKERIQDLPGALTD